MIHPIHLIFLYASFFSHLKFSMTKYLSLNPNLEKTGLVNIVNEMNKEMSLWTNSDFKYPYIFAIQFRGP